MLSKIKSILKKLPVPLSRNHRYDLLTKKIIRQHCSEISNCIDVGAHEGTVLAWFLKYAPGGKHFAFEPVPDLFHHLKEKYSGSNCEVYEVALSDKKGMASFNYVTSNPAYSGLKKRKYDRSGETDLAIQVQTDVLDDMISEDTPVHFVKIDVEGGELNVLKGAQRILRANHPIVVFEFGMGGSDIYGVTPDELFFFLQGFDYKIFLLEDFINKRSPLTLDRLQEQFYKKKNYYFVAHR